MSYNFLVHPPKQHWREIFLFLFFIWMLVIRNVFLMHELKHPSQPMKKESDKPVSMMNLCAALMRLPPGERVIHKMDIHSHEMLLYGQASTEDSLGRLIAYFNQIHEVIKVEVLQWDYIKSGHWRFIIALAY